jgi:isopentenyl diphosphate isomerase/L-lactate dehydrogenase-like FMN-dependent dehydrogenase
MSICSIEDVAQHAGPGFWFQLYVMRDRDFIERLIDRAKAAGCGALVSRWTCRSWASATRTSRTACPPRPSRRWPT